MASGFSIAQHYKVPAERVVSRMRRHCSEMSVPVHKVLLFAQDLIVIGLGGVFSAVLFDTLTQNSIWLKSSEVVLTIALLTFFHLFLSRFNKVLTYQVVLNRVRHFSVIFRILTISFLSIFIISRLFTYWFFLPDERFLILYYAILFLMFTLSRVIILPPLFELLVKAGIVNRNLLIVGVCPSSIDKALFLKKNSRSYFNVVGFVRDGKEWPETDTHNIPVLGDISQLNYLSKTHNINDILICNECDEVDQLHDIITICKETHKTIHIVSDLYGILDRKMEIEEIGRISSFRVYPKKANLVYSFLKRSIDIMGASMIILGLLPVWLFIALAIKLDSRGPIFYKPRMIGKDGQLFTMYKFRSMTHNCGASVHKDKVINMIRENGDTKKLRNDSRITRVGRILRKLSFDEFPQLINVLIGNMSLVGPRPCLSYEYDVMKTWQQQRTAVKPGMTGLWQIKGRDEVLFNEQMILDLYYIEHQSVLFDIEILFETIPVVIFGKGGS